MRNGITILYLKKLIIKKFTMVELLVVISIIIILAGLLLPALKKAKETIHVINCANNEKQQGIALAMYVEDYNSFYPPSRPNWRDEIMSYLKIEYKSRKAKDLKVFICSRDQVERATTDVITSSYAANAGSNKDNLDGVIWDADGVGGAANLSQIGRPSVLINLAEWWYAYNTIGKAGYPYNCIISTHMGYGRTTPYHNGSGGGNYLFCDGHVKYISNPSIDIRWGIPGKYEFSR